MFSVLGANIAAVQTAASFGIARNRAVDYRTDEKETRALYETMSAPITAMRNCEDLGDNWCANIEADFNNHE